MNVLPHRSSRSGPDHAGVYWRRYSGITSITIINIQSFRFDPCVYSKRLMTLYGTDVRLPDLESNGDPFGASKKHAIMPPVGQSLYGLFQSAVETRTGARDVSSELQTECQPPRGHPGSCSRRFERLLRSVHLPEPARRNIGSGVRETLKHFSRSATISAYDSINTAVGGEVFCAQQRRLQFRSHRSQRSYFRGHDVGPRGTFLRYGPARVFIK